MIRKIIALLIISLFIGGVASARNLDSPGIGDKLGQGKFESDPHKIFRLVHYDQVTQGSGTLAADSIVIWDLTQDDGVTVTTTTTSWDSAVAGILVTQALTQETSGNTAAQDRGKRNWAWLQTYGKSQVNLSTTEDCTAGDVFGTSTTAGEATIYEPSVADTGAKKIDAAQQGKAGFFYDNGTAGDDDVECFIILD